MGFSESAGTLILFTASVAVAAGVVGLLSVTVQQLVESGEQRGQELADRLRTDVQVINDPAELPTSPVVVYAKNTGLERLEPNGTSLLVDGQVRATATRSVVNASAPGWWSPGEVLEFTDADLTLAAGDHTVTVVAGNGVRDSLRVRV